MDWFIYPFLLDNQERYVLWFTDAADGVLTRDDRIATFSSVEDARASALSKKLHVAAEVSPLLDLRWLAQDALRSDNLDCVKILNAWNFFVDVAASLPSKAGSFIALDKTARNIYEKVFWGNNLPAVTPAGKRFDPTWSEEDLIGIKAVLETGLSLFVSNLG